MDLINKHVIENAAEYRKNFLNAKPFRHVVIDNFFEADTLSKLVKEFPSFGTNKGLVGDYGGKSKKGGRSDVRNFGPTFIKWDNMAKSKEFLDLVGHISDIPDLLHDPEYMEREYMKTSKESGVTFI